MKLIGMAMGASELRQVAPPTMRSLAAQGKALIALSDRYTELARIGRGFASLTPQLTKLADALELKLGEATVTTATDYKSLLGLNEAVATTQYRIGKATVAAYLQKLGKFETHQIRANSQEEFAYVLTTLADGDKKIHGAQWNDMMVAKPNETVQAVLARDRQIGDAGARNYSPLDKVAARLAKLSHSTPEPVAKERVRNESALVAAVKAESLENPIFGFMRVAKNTKEATTLTRWAKANLLGAAPTEQKIANLRRNLNDLVLRSDAQEIWTDEMLNRELGALATR